MLLPAPVSIARRIRRAEAYRAIAARLGISEGAVEARLQRGKRALARLLAGEFRAEALAVGLPVITAGSWQETDIWCSNCGTTRLIGRLTPGECVLRCPRCYQQMGQDYMATSDPQILRGGGFGAILRREIGW